ncbi:uncharacterized protein LOC135522026 isoform X2 [Oncorhynchus masou masou]|uniref:uncharacterized protein LOC135522026 isoform X2 n=1 Tax=Oncorhynchus masou masou TaxID=90313 RepID=UPI0031832DA6
MREFRAQFLVPDLCVVCTCAHILRKLPCCQGSQQQWNKTSQWSRINSAQLEVSTRLEHWKMLRLLFLCLIVTLQGAAASSEESEGSADAAGGDDEDLFKQNGGDDEDLFKQNGEDDEDLFKQNVIPNLRNDYVVIEPETNDIVDTNKATGEKVGEDGFTTIVIIVAVSVVALSIAVIVAIVLVRRRMHNRPQGVYSVPAEQGMKGTV